jgi:hypothetical protein
MAQPGDDLVSEPLDTSFQEAPHASVIAYVPHRSSRHSGSTSNSNATN